MIHDASAGVSFTGLAEHHLLLLSVYESREENDLTKLNLFGAAAVLAGELEKSQELPLHLGFVGMVINGGDGKFEHQANDPQNGDHGHGF